jgi:uncharacterized protein
MLPWFEVVGFIVFGFFIGTYGSMVGVGGGFFIVPVLLFLGYPSRIAAGTSLVVVLANSLSSSFSYLRQRRVDVRSALIFAAAGIPGAVLGAYAAQHVPRHLFSILFGVLLVLVALRSFFSADPPPLRDDPPPPAGAGDVTREFVDASGARHSYSFNLAGGIAVSAVTGFLASLFGVGGGIVQVPAMVYLFNFPAHIAIGTSQVIIAITAASGSLSHAYYGDIVALPALFLSIGAIAGAQVGARLASRMRAVALMRWLSLAVAAAAIFLIARS